VTKKAPIQFIYSNNKKIGSRIISFACRDHGQLASETPSHFSILIYEWIIIESTMARGVAPKLFSTFMDTNKIIAIFEPKTDSKGVVALAKRVADNIRKARYDFLAALYVGWRSLLRYYCDKKIPATNKFDNAKEFFCNEIYRDIYGGDVSMKHPNWLLNDMNKDENLLRVF